MITQINSTSDFIKAVNYGVKVGNKPVSCAKLSEEAGLARSTIHRVMVGQSEPTLITALLILEAAGLSVIVTDRPAYYLSL